MYAVDFLHNTSIKCGNEGPGVWAGLSCAKTARQTDPLSVRTCGVSKLPCSSTWESNEQVYFPKMFRLGAYSLPFSPQMSYLACLSFHIFISKTEILMHIISLS